MACARAAKAWLGVAFVAGMGWVQGADAAVLPGISFTANGQTLRIEALSDTLIHAELAAVATASSPQASIPTGPFVARTEYPGPTKYTPSADGFATASFQVRIDSLSLCASFIEISNGETRARVCPRMSAGAAAGLTLSSDGAMNAYGLGEKFFAPGQVNGDWLGKVREPGLPVGNTMEAFEGGGVGNALFPILYVLGQGTRGFGFFLDDIRPQTWDLSAQPWQIAMTPQSAQAARFYFIGGADLTEYRRQYMDLVGRPPVPPLKAFGMWLSEFGYRSWKDFDAKFATLRKNRFPIDGFVLDAFWCGSFATGDPHNHIGSMTFDEKAFPEPAETIANYARNDGLSIMLHEDPFINNWLSGFSDMSVRGGLVRTAQGGPPRVLDNYLGRVGIIDWTNDAAADFWHTSRREPLMNMGVDFHWTDFAEVDGYQGDDWYAGEGGVGNAAVDNHNYFSFKWAQSIARGYTELTRTARRPFILSRSGTAGIARFGTALWSGDIGSNMKSLAAQLNAQMHLSLSGLDYFGSDVGGYHREALEGDLNDVYTKWFAHSAAFDVPVRPHTNDWDGTQPTAPDRIGDRVANLMNLRLRYELVPYYYSLAHAAYENGDGVVMPLVYAYPADPQARELGDEKMIGPWLLVAAAPVDGPVTRYVYLPAGHWIDYRTHQLYASHGQSVSFNFSTNGHFTLPYLAREGAIFPILYVDDQTMNASGRRLDGTVVTDLNLKVFPSSARTTFTVREDDGETTAYQRGQVARTEVTQETTGDSAEILVKATQGSFTGAPIARRVVARVVRPGAKPAAVSLNGDELTGYAKRDDFEKADSGWFFDGQAMVLVRTPCLAVSLDKDILVDYSGG